jgi:hypothetical protein
MDFKIIWYGNYYNKMIIDDTKVQFTISKEQGEL